MTTQQKTLIQELINTMGLPKVCKSYIGCNVAVFSKTIQELINIKKKENKENVIKLYSVYYKLKFGEYVINISNRQNTYFSYILSEDDLNYLKESYSSLLLEGY